MERMSEEELLRSLLINKDGLDEELVNQSNLVYHAGMLHAKALSERDWAKEKYKRTFARLMRELQPILKEELGKAPTEKVLVAGVESHQDYVEDRDDFLGLDRIANEALVLKESLKDKGFAMHNLVQLVTSEVVSISGSSERPKMSGAEREERREKAHSRRESRKNDACGYQRKRSGRVALND